MYFYFFLNKGLINVYAIKLIKHKTDRPYGIVNIKAGIFISILYSLSVQLHVLVLS